MARDLAASFRLVMKYVKETEGDTTGMETVFNESVYRQRRQALEPGLQEMEKFLQLHGEKIPEHLQEPATTYTEAKQKLEKAESEPDYKAALQRLEEVDTARKAYLKLRYKKLCEENLEEFQKRIEPMDQAISEKKYGDPVAPPFKLAIAQYAQAKENVRKAMAEEKYQDAINFQNIDLGKSLSYIGDSARPVVQRWRRIKPIGEGIAKGIKERLYDGLNEAAEEFGKTWAKESVNAEQGLKEKNFAAIWNATEVIEPAIDKFHKAQCANFLKLGENGKDKKAITSTCARYLEMDPTFLQTLTQTLEGRQALDKLVKESLGNQADDKDSATFFKEAIKARFGLTKLEGDLTPDCLPRLYMLFSKVPDSHTRHDKLKQVKRNKNLKLESWYSPGSNATEGLDEPHIVLNGQRVSGPGSWFFNFVKEKFFDRHIEIKKGQKAPTAFDWTTLHELGHAVDEQTKFMDRKQKSKDCGAWNKETPASIAVQAGMQKGFFKDFEDRSVYSADLLNKYLVNVLTKQKGFVEIAKDMAGVKKEQLATDPAITAYEQKAKEITVIGQEKAKALKTAVEEALKATKLPGKARELVRKVLDLLSAGKAKNEAIDEVWEAFNLAIPEGKTPDWNALAKHPAVVWCETIREMGMEMIWKGEAKYQLPDKRVYQQAYAGQWWSYDSAAQGKVVTNYQFRAPGEWFAEVYAAYYLDVLPGSHPMFETMKDDKLAPEGN